MSRLQFETHELITRATAIQEYEPRMALRAVILNRYQSLLDGEAASETRLELASPSKIVGTTDIDFPDIGRWNESAITEEDSLFTRFMLHAVSILPHATAKAMMSVDVVSNTFLKDHRFQTDDPEAARNIFSSIVWIGAGKISYGRLTNDDERIKTPFYVVGENKDRVLLVPAIVDILDPDDQSSFLSNNLAKYDWSMNYVHPYRRGKDNALKGLAKGIYYSGHPRGDKHASLVSFPAMKPTDSIGKPVGLTDEQMLASYNPKTGFYTVSAATDGICAEELTHPFGLLQEDPMWKISAVGLEEWAVFDCLESLARRFHRETEYADMLRSVAMRLPEYVPGAQPDISSLQRLGAKLLTDVQPERSRHR